jgi:stearoyl-CoA desaturase (Delta-9 desaturase)
MTEDNERPPLAPFNIFFLGLAHFVGIAGTIVYAVLGRLTLMPFVLAAVWSALTIFSLSAGYHRLFSHKAYDAHPALRALLLFFGAASFQNSALIWAADHRRHHQRVDSPLDPYNIRQGFFHAHVGWVLHKTPLATDLWPVPDLQRDPLVAFQHRHYALVGFVSGVLLPTLIGWALGDALGAFIVAGGLRLVFVYHVTFSINSFAHTLGTQPYSDRNSARDSFVAAMLSMGEGYHNFHHTFPADYRNGVRAYQFDPSKWTIRALATVGLARNLKRTPGSVILRARLKMDERRLEQRTPLPERIRERGRELRQLLENKLHEWHDLVAHKETAENGGDRASLRRIRLDLRRLQRHAHDLYRDWCLLMHAAPARVESRPRR